MTTSTTDAEAIARIISRAMLDNPTGGTSEERAQKRHAIAAEYASIIADDLASRREAQEPVAWLRDLDGTGSLHPASQGDPEAFAVYRTAPPAPAGEADISALVDRFLSWPLPQSVCSDPCVTDPNYQHPRSGTNLLTATEARQMIEYLLAGMAAPAGEVERLRGEIAYALTKRLVIDMPTARAAIDEAFAALNGGRADD